MNWTHLEEETKEPFMKPNAERHTNIETIHEKDPINFSANDFKI